MNKPALFHFNRPLVAVTLSYIAGITWGWVCLDSLPGWLGLLLLPLLVLFYRKLFSGFAAFLLLGAAVAGAASFFISAGPPAEGLLRYSDRPLFVEGTVAEEPLRTENETAYRLRVQTVETQAGRFPVSGKLLVKVYGADQEPHWVGETLRLRGVIREPRGRRNPGGFDYRFYLRTEGMTALMSVRPYQVVSLGRGETGRLSGAAAVLRTRMSAAIEKGLPSPAAELLIAILFGQRHHLPEAVAENFRTAGVGHLMAVSGLHVGLVAAMILALWRRLGLRGRWPLAAAILLIFGYAFLTGMRPSALRAAVMLSFALAALLFDRPYDLPTAMAAAALITLAGNPLLLLTAGFQLSYAATLAIVYGAPPLAALFLRLCLPVRLCYPLAVTVAAQVGVLPLTVFHFGHIPVLAVFFNLLVLPVIAPALGLGLAGALLSLVAPTLALPLFWTCRPLLEYLLALTALSRLPGFYRAVFPPRPLEIFLAGFFLIALLWFYYNRDALKAVLTGPVSIQGSLHRRYLIPGLAFLFLMLTVLWAGPLGRKPPRLVVTCLDVGQGSATLIEAPCGRKILVDAGGGLSVRGEPEESGTLVLLPFLRHRRIRALDLAVITHPHEDHFGGMLPLLETVEVAQLLISPVPGRSPYYETLLESAVSRGLPVVAAHAGSCWECACGLRLEVLYPSTDALARLNPGGSGNLNDASLVLRLTYGAACILFTGDVEEAAVRELLRHRYEDLEATVLVVPHHGGKLSIMEDFLAAVKPRVAVIPVGANPFGHPHPETLRALEKSGALVLRNDRHGAVILRSDGCRLTVETMDEYDQHGPVPTAGPGHTSFFQAARLALLPW